jgi:hypothetical protein
MQIADTTYLAAFGNPTPVGSAVRTEAPPTNRTATGTRTTTRGTTTGKNPSANTERPQPGTAVSKSPSPGKAKLTDEERQQVEELAQRDREVRRHEQAHKAAAGPHARGGPTYEYATGPDGKRYAVGGEVQIDVSPVRGDPQATIAKMQQVRRAALAPAEPSSQDRQVAAQAAAHEREARRQLNQAEDSPATGPSADRQSGSSVADPGQFLDFEA